MALIQRTCGCSNHSHPEAQATGFRKVAKLSFSDIHLCNEEQKTRALGSLDQFVKLASSKDSEGSANFKNVLKEEIAKHPNALFFRAKAIEADKPNNNGDSFSTEQLKKSCQTFVGVPFFTNHQNDDVEKAKGKIIFAEWDEKEKAIYTIAFIDRDAYPGLARGVEQEYVTGVSMGAVSAGTPIWVSNDGKIEEKPIEDVKAGDKVLTHKSRLKDVKKTHCEFLGESMIRPILKTYHKSPYFTKSHPVFVIDNMQLEASKSKHVKLAQKNKHSRRSCKTDEFVGQDGWRRESYVPEFRSAGDLGVGDCVLIPSRYSLNGYCSDEEFYYLVGTYLGDGFVKLNKHGDPEGICFCLGRHDVKLADKIIGVLQKYSMSRACVFDVESRNGKYVTVYDRKLANSFLAHFGSGCKKKRLNSFPIQTRECAINLLSGYLDTDGCIVDKTKQDVCGSKFGGIQISSSNLSLLEDIQNLLICLGHVSRISSFVRQPSENSVVHIETTEHTLSVGSNAVGVFSKSIKVADSNVVEAAGILAGESFITKIGDINYMACPIKSLEIVETWNEPVYDLTIVDDESYIANGIAIHNCSVEYSVCSICNNRAASQDDYCYHIRNLKGRKFSGEVKDVKTGQTKSLKDAPVYEDNYGIRFIELSGVVDPACPSCHIEDIYANDDFMKAASSCYNGIAMFKTSSVFKKEASEQDVQKLNQALEILQDISIKLIQQRQNIEMEFSADLVTILADLQEYVDGLVQAGFGRLPDVPGNVPDAASGQTPAPQPTDQAPGEMPPPPMGGMDRPISAEQSMATPPGDVTGNPAGSLIQGPVSPAAGLSEFQKATRPSPGGLQHSKLQRPVGPSKRSSKQEEDVEMRRIPQQSESQKRRIASALDSAWKENVEKISNMLRDSLQDDLVLGSTESDKTGGIVMAGEIKEARAKETPNTVMERRLDTERGGLHPRTESAVEETMGKQLAGQHANAEPNEVEQGLLEKARTNDYPKEVEERQLEPNREGATAADTLQVKIESQRTGVEPNSTLQDLLSHPKVDTPSTRTASTNEHIDAAVDILSRVVVASQSTPKRVKVVAGKMASAAVTEQVGTIKSISEFKGEVPSFEDFSDRTAFWQNKGLQVTSASDNQIKDLVIALSASALKKSAATKLNAETLLKAFAVLKNNPHTDAILTAKIDALVASGNASSKDVEDSMGDYLSSMVTAKGKKPLPDFIQKKIDEKAGKKPEEKTEDESDAIEQEANALEAAIGKEASSGAGLIIETSFDEMNIPADKRGDDAALKPLIQAFVQGACAHLNVKKAAVLNVTVDAESGDVVIAVDTAGEGAVEIPASDVESPIEDSAKIDEEMPDTMVGEDLEDSGIPPAPDAAGAAGAPTPPPAPAGENFGATTPPPAGGAGVGAFSKTKKSVKTAQFGGGAGPGAGAGGAAPDAGGAGAAGPGAGGDLNPAPGDAEGLQSFTGEDEEELPGDEEQKMPGSICPICGSTDTETGKKDQGPGQFDCSSCGIKYSVHVNIEILNPEELNAESDDVEADLESPEAPSMPVAAMIDVNRDSFRKIAQTQKDVGHICPACGTNEVDSKGTAVESEIICKKCNTTSEKSMLVNIDNPIETTYRVAWNIDPMKRKCPTCRQAAKRMASDRVFDRLVKHASVIEIPETKVRAWLADNYPGVITVTNGPYKGEKFADVVVGQIKRFGFTKMKYLKALADAQSQADPMDICIKDHKKKGYALAESERLCGCLKEKYASEEDSNIYMQALSGMVNVNILRKMASFESKKFSGTVVEFNGDKSLFELPDVVAKTDNKKAMTTEEISLDLRSSVGKTAADKGEKKLETGKNTEKKVKEVEDIADNANETPSPSRGAIGGESKEKIPGPTVPRSNATMGDETKLPAEGVKVPSKGKGGDNFEFCQKVDTSALGNAGVEAGNKDDEMKKQAYGEIEPMKRVKNPEVKNPDSTSGDTALDEKSDSEKSVNVVESLEDHDDVPRSEATINDESPACKTGPDVPRSKATMGNEKPPKEQKVTVPSEVSETDLTMRGRQAERNHQMEKIATARREHAQRFAGQLLERGVIKDDEVASFVEDLSALPLDRMKTHVALMMKQQTKKTAATSNPVLATPIVREAETFVEEETEAPSLADKLAGMFTIGDMKANRAIRQAMVEEAASDKKLGW